MTIKVPISSVVQPRFMAVFVDNASTTPPTPSLMEIYTGTVEFDFEGDDLERTQVQSFVPFDNKFNVLSYVTMPTAITVVGALTSLSTNEDSGETHIAAIDSVTADVELRVFPGFSASVLIMTAQAAVRKGGVGRFAYQVTVLADQRGDGSAQMVVNLGGAQTP